MKGVFFKGAGCKVLPLFLFISILRGGSFKWTIGLYMAGDNDLAPAMDEDLREIKRARINSSINVVVFADRGIYSESPGTFVYVKRDTFLMPVMNLGNLDSGDPTTLSFFINYLKSNFPSENYALVIWGHGKGWLKGDDFFYKSVAYDASSTNSIEVFNGELSATIPDFLFNVIIFDACLMGSVEVLLELQNKATYVIASPALVPAYGLNYTALLEAFAIQKTEDVWRRIVEDYIQYYDSLGYTVSLGVYDLSKVEMTLDIIKDAVESSYIKSTTELLKYRFKSTTYNTFSNEIADSSSDLVDLAELLRKGWGIDSLPLVLFAKGNLRFENSSFLSVYFPVSYPILKRDFSKYRCLNFERRIKFLDLVLNALRDSLMQGDTLSVHYIKGKGGYTLFLKNLIKASKWQCELRVEKEGTIKQTVYFNSEKFFLKLTPGLYRFYLRVITNNSNYFYSLFINPDTLRVEDWDTPFHNSIVSSLEDGFDILGRKSQRAKILFKDYKKYIVY